MVKSKRTLNQLLKTGLIISPEKRTRLRRSCRKFKTPATMALGLLLDAIRIMETQK